MERIRDKLQHRFNPLHLYCRLRAVGLTHNAASLLSRCYERALYRIVLA